ncbi:MAG: ABC transporter substrate-binding protein [Anaeromyxobacteraceae bacterium]
MGTLRASKLPRRGRPRRLTAFVLAVAAVACAGRPRERLVIGLPRLPSNTLLFLAADGDHARDEGLDLVLVDFPTGKDALAAALAGKVDAAAAYETPIVFEAFKGAPLRILTTLHTSTRSMAVVARADRGVKGASDLAGRRVGVARGTNAEFFLRTILASSGLRWDDAQIVDVTVADFGTALASGRVDALATWSPFVERVARDLGPDRATVLHSDVYAEVSMLVAPADVLAARRTALAALLRALARAERVAAERPDAAFAAVRARLPDGELAEARQSWEHISPRLGISNALVASLRSEAEWLVAEGVANAVPDFRPLLVPELLDAIDPEAVTLEEPP